MKKRIETYRSRRPFIPRVTPVTERVDLAAAAWEFPPEMEPERALPDVIVPSERFVPLWQTPPSRSAAVFRYTGRTLIWLGIVLAVGVPAVWIAGRATGHADAMSMSGSQPASPLKSRRIRAIVAARASTALPGVISAAIEPPPEPASEPERRRLRDRPRSRDFVRASRQPARVNPDLARANSRDHSRPVTRDFVPAVSRDVARTGSGADARTGSRDEARASSRDVAAKPARAARSEPAAAAAPPASVGFHGALAVDSEPAGARVFLNGRPVGSTPLVLDQVPAGSTVVRVEADAHQPWSSAIRIVANEQTRIAATLKR